LPGAPRRSTRADKISRERSTAPPDVWEQAAGGWAEYHKEESMPENHATVCFGFGIAIILHSEGYDATWSPGPPECGPGL